VFGLRVADMPHAAGAYHLTDYADLDGDPQGSRERVAGYCGHEGGETVTCSRCGRKLDNASSRPRLLDLFCGAGGAGMGYYRAGFEVVGVDNRPMPRYPFEFHQAEALEYCKKHSSEFDAIHASPPCQRYSRITKVRGTQYLHADMVTETRSALIDTGKPYIIENVCGSPVLAVLVLCGSMFPPLEVRRHRLFETSFLIFQPECRHDKQSYAVPVYGHSGAGANRGRERQRGRSNGVADWARAMDIDWMTGAELCQAIPPAYTEFIGRQLIDEMP
jgi:DNA (cytosine-5)-methyltransferase 1